MNYEEISEKYNIDVRDLKFIQKKYGSIENFAIEYAKSLMNGEQIFLRRKDFSNPLMANCIVITEDGIEGRFVPYIKFITDILDVNVGFVIDGEFEDDIDAIINDESMTKTMKNGAADVVKKYYGIGCERLTQVQIAKDHNITKQRVAQIVDSLIAKYRNAPKTKALKSRIMSGEEVQDAIISCFTFDDVLAYADLNGADRRKQFYGYVLKKKIEKLEFTRDYSYIRAVVDLHRELEHYSLSDEDRKGLSSLLDEKKKEIASLHEGELIDLIKKRIADTELNKRLNIRLFNGLFNPQMNKLLSENNVKTIRDILVLSRNGLMEFEGMTRQKYMMIMDRLELLGFSSVQKGERRILADLSHYDPVLSMETPGCTYTIKEEIRLCGLSEKVREKLSQKFMEEMKKDITAQVYAEFKEKLGRNKNSSTLVNSSRNNQDENQDIYLSEVYTEDGTISADVIEIWKDKTIYKSKMNKSLYSFNFSARAIHFFEKIGVHSVCDLLDLTKKEIEQSKDMGEQTIRGIYAIIESMGYNIPLANNIKICDHNKYILMIEKGTIDFASIAKQINESEYGDEAKSELLSYLFKITLKELQEVYDYFEELKNDKTFYIEFFKATRAEDSQECQKKIQERAEIEKYTDLVKKKMEEIMPIGDR